MDGWTILAVRLRRIGALCFGLKRLAALKAAIVVRPNPVDKSADSDCVFITRHGRRYVRLQLVQEGTEGGRDAKYVQCNAVTEGFGKLLKKLKINGRVGLRIL